MVEWSQSDGYIIELVKIAIHHKLKYENIQQMLKQDTQGSVWVVSVAMSRRPHYDDVIMGAMASQITSLTIVYSTVYSDAYQRKHLSSASLAFVRGSHRDRWIPRTNGQ